MIPEFISHLEAQLVTAGNFTTVAHAWDVEPFSDIAVSDLPAVLVFRGRDLSEPSQADNLVKQRKTAEIWCYVIAAHADLDARRAELFAAALGWQATAYHDALEHERGETRKLSGDLIWWLDVFTTAATNSQT